MRDFCELREVNGHSRRALVPVKEQWMSCVGVPSGAALHTIRQPTSATVSPNSPIGMGIHHRLGVVSEVVSSRYSV